MRAAQPHSRAAALRPGPGPGARPCRRRTSCASAWPGPGARDRGAAPRSGSSSSAGSGRQRSPRCRWTRRRRPAPWPSCAAPAWCVTPPRSGSGGRVRPPGESRPGAKHRRFHPATVIRHTASGLATAAGDCLSTMTRQTARRRSRCSTRWTRRGRARVAPRWGRRRKPALAASCVLLPGSAPWHRHRLPAHGVERQGDWQRCPPHPSGRHRMHPPVRRLPSEDFDHRQCHGSGVGGGRFPDRAVAACRVSSPWRGDLPCPQPPGGRKDAFPWKGGKAGPARDHLHPTSSTEPDAARPDKDRRAPTARAG